MRAWLPRTLPVHKSEWPPVLWALLYVLALFLAYYVLRPIRDDMGVAGGVRNLPWLFSATLAAMLVLNPLFAWAVRTWERRHLLARVSRFFCLHLLLFAAALHLADDVWQVWLGRAFFVWVSVFNLCVVSLFWSLMVDVFDRDQGKRLFGLLAAGATAGGILGSSMTAILVGRIERLWLMLLAVAFLEMALWAAQNVLRFARKPAQAAEEEKPLGGSVFSGMQRTFSSPCLAGIAAFILLYAITSTFLYFQQAYIAESHFTDRAQRTAFFAHIDLAVNASTLFLQIFVTARLIAARGIGLTLCILPLASLLGFAALAFQPGMASIVAAQVLRRVCNFAFAKPAREILFTAVCREDRYKAKNFMDTVVYRSGDQIASWSHAGLMALGVAWVQIPLLAMPLSALWLALAAWLGRRASDGKT